ncbi:hypothetical protein EBO33_22775 [[Curtobacterium] plantarum]|nr:hypothetical protein EBO33_22775 [[Curtobacterium] plantarum]
MSLTPGVEGGVGNGELTAELTGSNPGFSFAENTEYFHGDVLMWPVKTLLTSRCVNQLEAGHLP